jgi:excisionase family DNA binding protein
MNALPTRKQIERDAERIPAPLLVPAKTIARRLSVSSRYVHILAEQGTIPHHRFGKCCIRFSEPAVLAALGITEAVAIGAGQ